MVILLYGIVGKPPFGAFFFFFLPHMAGMYFEAHGSLHVLLLIF